MMKSISSLQLGVSLVLLSTLLGFTSAACSPTCTNGGICVNNACQCLPCFSGVSCAVYDNNCPCTVQGHLSVIQYASYNGRLDNPGRGLYKRFDTQTNAYTFLNETMLQSAKQDGITLVLRVIKLPNPNVVHWSLAMTIASVRDYLAKDFEILQRVGMKAILRFVYTTGADATPYEPEETSTILSDINAMFSTSPVFPFDDLVLTYQMGFIGLDGDWNNTSYFGSLGDVDAGTAIEDRSDVLNALYNVIPLDKQLQVASPYWKRLLLDDNSTIAPTEAFMGDLRSSIGFYNDHILSSANDMGFFQDPNDDAYVAAESAVQISGGRISQLNSPLTNCTNVINRARSHHYTFIDSDSNPAVLAALQAGGCADMLAYNLGYRFRLDASRVQRIVSKNGNFDFAFQVYNDGFAAPMTPYSVSVILRQLNNPKPKICSAELVMLDVRTWLGQGPFGIQLSLSDPGLLVDGDYEVLLEIADQSNTLRKNSKYKIALANEGLFESYTGFNRLKQIIHVAGNSSQTPPPQSLDIVCSDIYDYVDEWPAPRKPVQPGLRASVLNGGFEGGITNWDNTLGGLYVASLGMGGSGVLRIPAGQTYEVMEVLQELDFTTNPVYPSKIAFGGCAKLNAAGQDSATWDATVSQWGIVIDMMMDYPSGTVSEMLSFNPSYGDVWQCLDKTINLDTEFQAGQVLSKVTVRVQYMQLQDVTSVPAAYFDNVMCDVYEQGSKRAPFFSGWLPDPGFENYASPSWSGLELSSFSFTTSDPLEGTRAGRLYGNTTSNGGVVHTDTAAPTNVRGIRISGWSRLGDDDPSLFTSNTQYMLYLDYGGNGDTRSLRLSFQTSTMWNYVTGAIDVHNYSTPNPWMWLYGKYNFLSDLSSNPYAVFDNFRVDIEFLNATINCPEGYIWSNATANFECTACPSGYYCAGNNTVTPCPNNTWAPLGLKNCEPCACRQGTCNAQTGQCSCPPNWTGTLCDIYVHNCTSGVCLSGAEFQTPICGTPPNLLIPLTNITTNVGEWLRIEPHLEGDLVTFNWYDPNDNVIGYDWSLLYLIEDASFEGVYRFEMYNTAGHFQFNFYVTVLEELPQNVAVSPPTTYAHPGDAVSVTGYAEGATSTGWSRDGVTIFVNGTALTFSSIGYSDTGTYTFFAFNDGGYKTKVAHIYVLAPGAPIIVSAPSRVYAHVGDTVQLRVNATNAINYDWHRVNSDAPMSDNETFKLQNVSINDQWRYVISVSNNDGVTETYFDLLIWESLPTVIADMVTTTVPSGGNINFFIDVIGTNLTFQWRHEPGNVLYTTNPSFSVPSADDAIKGNWHVHVTSLAGTISRNFSVDVVEIAPFITNNPASQSIPYGTNYYVDFGVSGSHVTYAWTKDSSSTVLSTSYFLTISSVTFAHAGTYYVNASNSAGWVTASATLSVYVGVPVILSMPPLYNGVVGQTIGMMVTVQGVNYTVAWYRLSDDVLICSTDYCAINNAQLADSGDYMALVSNSAGSISANTTVTVVAWVPPPTNVTITTSTGWRIPLGGVFSATVSANGTDVAYTWMKEGLPMPMTMSATFIIPAVDFSHNAKYYAVASTTGGAVESAHMPLVVYEDAPFINTTSGNVTKAQGSNFTIYVNATGSNLNYYWYKLPDKLNLLAMGSTLWFFNANATMAGNYSVIVNNTAGSANITIRVGVDSLAVLCTAGSFSSSGRLPCTVCPKGTFTNSPGSQQCQNCSAGSFSDKTNTSTCALCPAGSTSLFGATVCLACAKGTFSPFNGSSICYGCAAGNFSANTGVSACTLCEAGKYSDGNATVCTKCAAGAYSVNGSARCMPCEAGTSSASGDATCTECAKGFYSKYNDTSCSQCAAGKFSASTRTAECTPCSAGSSSTQGRTMCTACTAGTFSDIEGAPSCSLCDKGKYSEGNAQICTGCAAGRYADVKGLSVCTLCKPGTFMGEPGAVVCTPCAVGSFTRSSESLSCSACASATSTGFKTCPPRPIFSAVLSETGASKSSTAFTGSNADLAFRGADFTLLQPPATLSFDASASTGEITATSWMVFKAPNYTASLGNGTSSTFAHTISNPGFYIVVLQMTGNPLDNAVTAAAVRVRINEPPVMAVAASVNTGNAPLTVTFSAAASTDDFGIDSFVWDVAGTIKTTRIPTLAYTFTAGGSYAISVTGIDTDGINSTASLGGGVVVNQPPVAAITAVSNLTGAINFTAIFNATGSSDPDGSIAQYLWNFGDGTATVNMSNASSVQHKYTAANVYEVSLRVVDNGGASATAYRSVTITTGPPPVNATATPVLLSAKFVDAVTSLQLTFDSVTNQANMKSNDTNCSLVISSQTVPLLGASPQCTWLSKQLLDVRMGSGATIVVGDSVSTRVNVLKSADGTSLAAGRMTVSAQAPNSAPTAKAALAAPEQVGQCSGVVLSAGTSSGNAGRPFAFAWALDSYAGTTLTDVQLLNLNYALAHAPPAEGRLSLAATLLPSNHNYTFSLRVTNWIGSTSSTTATVRKSAVEVPTVSISSGVLVKQRRDRELRVVAVAEAKSCGNGTEALTVSYVWTQLLSSSQIPASSPVSALTIDGAAVTIPANSRKSRFFTLPINTLAAGSKYGFMVTASLFVGNSTTALGSSRAYVGVEVERSPLSAGIKGGDRLISRSASAPATFTVDGSASLDPDDRSNAVALSYSWSCTRQLGGNCFSAPQIASYLIDAATITIPTNILADTSTNNGYVFSLTVSKDIRTSSAATVTLLTTADVVPVVKIEPQATAKANKDSKLVLKGVVPPVADSIGGAYTLQWAVTTGNLDLSAAGVLASTTTGRNLIIKEGMLGAGATYGFSFSVTDVGTGKTGRSSTAIVVNGPPSLGSCFSTPSSGEALKTKFVLSCSDWTDDADDMPLQYSFRIRGADGVENSLSSFQSSNVIETTSLPQGLAATGYNHTIVAYIRDIWSGTAKYEFKVHVTAPQITQAAVNNYVKDLVKNSLSSATAASDPEAFAQNLFSVTALLSQNTASNNASAAAERASIRKQLLTGMKQVANSSTVSTDSALQQAQMIKELTGAPGELDSASRLASVSFVTSTLDNALAAATASTDGVDATIVNSIATAALTSVANIGSSVVLGHEDNTTTNATANQALITSIMNTLASISLLQAAAQTPGEEPTVIQTDSLYMATKLDYPDQFANTEQKASDSDASFTLPASPFAGSGVAEDEVLTSSFYVSDNNFFVTTATDNPSVSPIVSLSFYGANGDIIDVADLNEPIRFTIPLTDGSSFTSKQRPLCRFWDEDAQDWSTDGCKWDENGSDDTKIVCLCTHLTSFNAAVEEFTPTVSLIGASDIKNLTWHNLMKHPTALITVIIVFLIYLMVLPFAMRRDATLQRRIHVLSSYEVGQSVKDLAAKMVAGGDEEQAPLVEITDADLLAITPKPDLKLRWRAAKQEIYEKFREEHLWFSVALRRPTDPFTSVQRLTIVLGIIFGTVAFNAMFFGQNQHMGADILITLISGIAVVPATVLFAMVFQKAGPDLEEPARQARHKYIKHVLAQRKASELMASQVNGGANKAVVDGTASSSSRPASPLHPKVAFTDAAGLMAQRGPIMETESETDTGARRQSLMPTDGTDSSRARILPLGRTGSGSVGEGGETPFAVADSSNETGATTQAHIPQRVIIDPKSQAGSMYEVAKEEEDVKEKKNCIDRMCDFRLPLSARKWAYLGVVIYISGCVFLILVYGLKFDLDYEKAQNGEGDKNVPGKGSMGLTVSGRWLLSSVLSMFQDVLLTEPIGLFASTFMSVFIGTDVLASLFECWGIC